jgi:hypothetical protein
MPTPRGIGESCFLCMILKVSSTEEERMKGSQTGRGHEEHETGSMQGGILLRWSFQPSRGYGGQDGGQVAESRRFGCRRCACARIHGGHVAATSQAASLTLLRRAFGGQAARSHGRGEPSPFSPLPSVNGIGGSTETGGMRRSRPTSIAAFVSVSSVSELSALCDQWFDGSTGRPQAGWPTWFRASLPCSGPATSGVALSGGTGSISNVGIPRSALQSVRICAENT